jgi:hypothetical protein
MCASPSWPLSLARHRGVFPSAARLATSAPLMTFDEQGQPVADGGAPNDGFLRADANLSVLVVSDEEDSSPLPVKDYLRAFADLKGEAAYRDHPLMNVSAVIGDRAPEFDGEPSCSCQWASGLPSMRRKPATITTPVSVMIKMLPVLA